MCVFLTHNRGWSCFNLLRMEILYHTHVWISSGDMANNKNTDFNTLTKYRAVNVNWFDLFVLLQYSDLVQFRCTTALCDWSSINCCWQAASELGVSKLPSATSPVAVRFPCHSHACETKWAHEQHQAVWYSRQGATWPSTTSVSYLSPAGERRKQRPRAENKYRGAEETQRVGWRDRGLQEEKKKYTVEVEARTDWVGGVKKHL